MSLIMKSSARVIIVQEACGLRNFDHELSRHNLVFCYSESSWLCVLTKGRADRGATITSIAQYENPSAGRWMVCNITWGEIKHTDPLREPDERPGVIKRQGASSIRIGNVHINNNFAKPK